MLITFVYIETPRLYQEAFKFFKANIVVDNLTTLSEKNIKSCYAIINFKVQQNKKIHEKKYFKENTDKHLHKFQAKIYLSDKSS